MRRTRVADVMTHEVVSVDVDSSYKEIVQTMSEHGISGAPVVDTDDHVVGVVSEADLLAKEEFKTRLPQPRPAFEGRRKRAERRKAAGDTAGELMSSPAVTIVADRGIAEAARTLALRHLKRLPVVDEQGRLTGVVSRADLLIPFLRSDAEIRTEMIEEVVERSLWETRHNIQVSVDEGVVTLRGRLELDTLIPLAVRLAASVDGVVDVVSELSFARKAEKYPTSDRVPW